MKSVYTVINSMTEDYLSAEHAARFRTKVWRRVLQQSGDSLFRFIAFSSLNSSDSRSEEFNDEKLMMRCKLSEPSLKKWSNDPGYTIIFLMIRAVIKKMMQWSLN